MFCSKNFGQIPIAEDINIGKAKLLMTFKKNGFTFIKESKLRPYKTNPVTGKRDIPDDEFFEILFKEEITLDVFYNRFGNITNILIRTEDLDYFEKLKNMFSFSKWIFDNKYIDFGHNHMSYYYEKINCTIIENGQISFSKK